MSTLNTGFAPTECVESIEIGRTYPKRAVISYLTGQPISECYKGDSSGKLIDCRELKTLIDFYGLLPLGPPRAVRFLGQHVIDAEIRRNTDSRMPTTYRRVSSEKLAESESRNDESVGSPKGRRRQTKGQD